MAKKRKQIKHVQMLSPENAIKQRARNLPIQECWVNENWKDAGMAIVIVIRKHVNGNITLGHYLVDLKCLGVKDTHYDFNLSLGEYRDFKEHNIDGMDMMEISYELAHNIVYAGLEYAEEYGFKPHKDFSISKYILEEDTDEVELIDIECGDGNGKPHYVQGEWEDNVFANKVIAQLEKTAGVGNYDFTLSMGQLGDDDDNDFFARESKFDEFDDMSLSELVDAFVERISEGYDNVGTGDEIQDELDYLSHLIMDACVDEDIFESIVDQLLNQFEDYDITEDAFWDMIGWESSMKYPKEQVYADFWNIHNLISEGDENVLEYKKKFIKQYPDLPVNAIFDKEVLSDSKKGLAECALVKITEEFLKISSEIQVGDVSLFICPLERIFGERRTIHPIEVVTYLTKIVTFLMVIKDIDGLEAVDCVIDDLRIDDKYIEPIMMMLQLGRVKFILSLKEQDEDQSNKTFQFKIQLKNVTKPPVWRKVEVPSQFTFLQFHQVIQVVMEWYNAHLFQFSPKGYASSPVIKLISEEDDDDWWGNDSESLDATKVKLSDVFKEEKQKYTYIYDFGDDWTHTITLEQILDKATTHPQIIKGKGHCPPEDCGGVWGYEDLKEILKNPKHPEYKEYREWLCMDGDEDWDANYFDFEDAKNMLNTIFSKKS